MRQRDVNKSGHRKTEKSCKGIRRRAKLREKKNQHRRPNVSTKKKAVRGNKHLVMKGLPKKGCGGDKQKLKICGGGLEKVKVSEKNQRD